jgi:hypothetical protein
MLSELLLTPNIPALGGSMLLGQALLFAHQESKRLISQLHAKDLHG